MGQLRDRTLRAVVHLASLAPLALIGWDCFFDNLTDNPIQTIQLRTGRYALTFLIVSLACSPFGRVLKAQPIVRLRRIFGLYGFLYATLHVLNLVVLDYRLDLRLLWEDVGSKRFALVGLAAFLNLLPLVVTSVHVLKARLKRNWLRLHWLVYAASPLAVAHFMLSVKADLRQPSAYAGLVALLLAYRLARSLGRILPRLRSLYGGRAPSG